MTDTNPDTAQATPPTRATPTEASPLTLAGELARIAPGCDLAQLCSWPPDLFAFTASALADSGAYRLVVSPPPGRIWPPDADGGDWEHKLRVDGAAWAAGEEPARLHRLLASLAASLETPLAELDAAERWPTLTDLLHLHALADEACADVGVRRESEFQARVAEQLTETGSLARLPVDRVRVLPKLPPPASGITLRSLSHHLALDRSEVCARWLSPPDDVHRPAERLTLLVIPHPRVVRASDFVPVAGPLANMDATRYGFYEYAPQEPLDREQTLALVERAQQLVGPVDAVVLPEGALDESEVEDVQRLLVAAGVPYLVAGVRRRATQPHGFGGNYAHFGAGGWQAPPQHKHHRWCLDESQVHQYHLGAALDPRRQWWEAIEVPRRCLTFVAISEQLTLCPLVCEDLARPDPVTDIVRSVAPTLVVALLLDGPQLAARWPARYASVLADDPGCSVLSLTALGMTQRSQPPGYTPSRVIALWKDPHRGLQEIDVAEDARGVALTAHARTIEVPTADGRSGKPATELVLSGVEQID